MKNNFADDCILVENYMRGDESALAVLLDRHKTVVFHYIFRKVRDRELAEDLFQDVFIRVINSLKLGKYSETGKFLPWITRIAHNVIVDYYRKNNRVQFVEAIKTEEGYSDIFQYLKTSEDNIEDLIIKDQILKDLKRLVVYLPQEQQEIISLRFYNDCSFKEIADMKNISINTALGRMRYALMNLRKLISQKNIILTEQ